MLEDRIIDDTVEYELALFPLNAVLFPTNLLPLRIFEPRYVDLIGACMRDGTGFGVVALVSGADTGRPGQTHLTGTIAKIVDFDQGADGLLNIVIRGDSRFRVRNTSTQANNLLVGQVADREDIAEVSIPEEFDALAELHEEISGHSEIQQLPSPTPETAAQLAYALAQYLPLPVSEKVALLEIDDPFDLLRNVADDVSRLQRANQ